MRADAITLKQLRALKAVAEAGSLAAAARALGQSAPTIHSQIRNLETALDRAVFERPVRGEAFRLTPQGREMLRAAERIEAHLSQATSTIAALEAGRSGRVRLAVVSTGKYFAPTLVRRLAEIRPDIEVVLSVGNRARTLEGMEQAAYDLIIMGRPPRMQMGNARPIGPHPHGIILPPGHPLAGGAGYDPDRLLAETFILREPGSGSRIVAERYLDRFAQGRPERLMEMESNETIKQAVIAGLGIAMISLHTVAEELRSGRLTLLKGQGLPVMRHWYLITPDGEAAAPAAATLAREITDMNAAFLPPLPGEG
ncbi:MAG: LysR family transcriptional regulator [Alphaproteobacteria bacterium]|nr:MAG: LysR family transcriptional regulator [Alphaproteobacteria bacterium]